MKKITLFFYNSIIVLVFFLTVQNSMAQSPPDAGSLLKEVEPQPQLENNVIPALPERVQPPLVVDGTSLPVKKFSFSGNTLVTDQQLQKIVQPWLNRKLTLAELKHITDLIAEHYRDKGYLVRVYLPEQNIHDGSVSIDIIEALFGKVLLDSQSKQLSNKPDLIEGMMTYRQHAHEPFNLSDIERSTLLVNDLPGISANAVLAASDQEKHTDIKLSIQDETSYNSYLSADNYGSRSTGRGRLIYSMMWANPFQRGDQINGNFMLSEGNRYAKLGYDLPLGFDGIRGGASISLLDYSLGGEFSDLDAEGNASNITLFTSYPLIRQTRENISLSAEVTLRDYENEQLGIQTSDKSVTAINLGISGDRVDGYQGGGVLYYGVKLILGDLDLSGNKTNYVIDKSSARTHGSYNKIDWNIARLQKVNDTMNLWLSARGQFADKNLDSSETISLGGVYGVRAYPTLEASGDEGIILTAELRYKFSETWNLKGFVDLGQITQKSTLTEGSENYTLKGLGVGADWNDPSQMMSARFVLATRIGDNPLEDPVTGDDTDGSYVEYPLWINITKHF